MAFQPQGRTGGVFDNKIGVLDMGDPMRWSDPGLEMRAEDNMPQAREHSAICYDPEVLGNSVEIRGCPGCC